MQRGEPGGRLDEDEQHGEATDDRQVGVDVPEGLHHLASRRAGRDPGAEQGAGDPAESADDRVHERVERPEDVELGEDDGLGAEGREDPRDAGDRRADGEGVELGRVDADAEARGRAFAGADGDQPPSGPPAAQVRHQDRDRQEGGQRQRRVAGRMPDRADVHPEEARRADVDAVEATGERAVLQDHGGEHEGEAEGGDGQVDAAGAHGRQGHEQPDRDDGEDAHGCCQPERPAEPGDELGGEPRPHAGERPLAQRQLPGVAGDDHDGHHQHGHDEQRRQRRDPDRRQHEHQGEQDGGAGEQPADVDPAEAGSGQPVGQVAAARQRPAPQHDHQDDHQERDGVADAGRGHVAGQLALRDAEAHRPEDREPERREATDQGGCQGGHHEQGQGRDLERGDRREQHGGQRGQDAGHRPVDELDHPGGPAEGRRRPAVLGHRGGGEAERRPGVDGLEDGRDGDGQTDQQQPVQADREAARQRDDGRRQGRPDQRGVGAPDEDGDAVEEREDGQGGDQPGDGRRLAEPAHHQDLDPGADRAAQPEGQGQRDRRRHAVGVAEGVEEPGRDGPGGTGRQVEDAGRPEHEHHAESHQGVEAARAEAEQGEPQDVHAVPPPGRGLPDVRGSDRRGP